MVRRVATANDASDEARVSSSDEVELGEDASAEVEGIKRDRGVIDSYTWCGLDGGKLRLEPVKDHNTEAPAIDLKVYRLSPILECCLQMRTRRTRQQA